MKYYFLLTVISAIIFTSCNRKSNLKSIYNCKSDSFSNLETVTDIKKLFSIEVPKNWKTNLYYDATQTSIYCADTTKQLTETTLIDVTFIYKPINFTKKFKEKIHLNTKLYQSIETISREIKVLKKPTFISISKGLKQGFPYQKSTIFIRINDSNYLLAKIELYGDSLVKKRFCKAFKLIDKIQLK